MLRSVHRLVCLTVTAALVAAILPIVVGGSPAAAADINQTIATLPSENPANSTPDVLDGEVRVIVQVGNRTIIGGTFSQIRNPGGGTTYNRTNIAAFNSTTGMVDTGFAPVLASGGDAEVWSIVPATDGTSIYIGGQFNTVNGTDRSKVARINLANGEVVGGFNAGNIDSTVRDMRLSGGTLYVAGEFNKVGTASRTGLASLNPTTGELTNKLNVPITGSHNGGATRVIKIEITPGAQRMMLVGNFSSVGGQARDQVALLNLSGASATVSPWNTTFFSTDCLEQFESYVTDVDISEDGTFVVFGSTGGYVSNGACDAVNRFELSPESGGRQPTWTAYTGGDSDYVVEIHDGVVYVGGHMRFFNNPFGNDARGAGGVWRRGMAALDQESGLPYSWNPGRERGVGVFDYHVTEAGIWAGSDTDEWAGETHRKLAFFPWAGGSTVPYPDIGTTPNAVVQLGKVSGSTGSADGRVLRRINVGGGELPSADDGPVWESDASTAGLRSGNSVTYTAPGSLQVPRTAEVPATNWALPDTDNDRPNVNLWTTLREGTAGPAMGWDIPIANGKPVTVRLYFANRSPSTDNVGDRSFDVSIDGNPTPINNIDLVRLVGHDVGTVAEYPVRSDGNIDIDFVDDVGEPLVNGIEIISRATEPPATFGVQDQVTRTQFSGSSFSGTATVAGTFPWRKVRGAFEILEQLYTFHADGQVLVRPASPTSLSAGSTIPVWSNEMMGEMAGMTGLFYDPEQARIYYTLSGSNQLHSRVFLHESQIIGAKKTTFSPGGMNPNTVRGMFLSGGRLYYADSSSGNLRSIAWSNGNTSGSSSVADSGHDWRSRALVRASKPQPNDPPVASFTASCAALTCAFDAGASSDPDGSIASYQWQFGDGTSGSGVAPAHTYPAPGTFQVKLTVTDDDGGVSILTKSFDVAVKGGNLTSVLPARLLETRPGESTVDGQAQGAGVVPADGVVTLKVAGRAGVPADADAAMLNIAAVFPAANGYLTLYPCNEPRPLAANVNYRPGGVYPNAVLAKLDPNGNTCIYTKSATHIVADINGYVPDGASPATVLPARLLETRPGESTVDGQAQGAGVVPADGVVTLKVAGRAGVPAGADAAMLNIAAVFPAANGYLTLYPCNEPRPLAANVNYRPGGVYPNAVLAKLDPDGNTCIYTKSATHIVADINGYVP